MGTELEPNNDRWVNTFTNFHYLKIPGAIRAISQLVAGTACVGSAYLDIATAKAEQISQGIRDTTEARSKTLAAYTEAAISKGVKDPKLIERALDYTAIKGIREQSNREKIAQEAVLLLKDQTVSEGTPPPEDDWMNIFVEYANKASSERMQKHWAAILAGEIKSPGRFSFSTLQIMSTMDTNLAQLIEKTSALVVSGQYIPTLDNNNKGQSYNDLFRLSSVGVLSPGHAYYYGIDPSADSTPIKLTIGETVITGSIREEISIPCWLLTPSGIELFSLASPSKNTEFIETKLKNKIEDIQTIDIN